MITFPKIPQLGLPEGMIHLGIGQPSPSLLPADKLRDAAANLPIDSTEYLAYGAARGDLGFRSALADFLNRESPGPSPITPDELFITNGNSQALDLVCTLFAKPGDTVLVEEPSYFLALGIFKDHGLNMVSIPVDGQGLRTDILEEKLSDLSPAFLYTIPVFHNPASITLSRERRRELKRIARENDLLVVADEVYQMLDYSQAPPSSLGYFHPDMPVLSLGSFSKILAPGLRLGWIHSSNALVKKLSGSGLTVSGGGLNPFTSEVVKTVMETGGLAANITHLKRVFKVRINAFCPLLEEILPDSARFHVPAGGYFIWVEFPGHVDTNTFRKAAQENKVDFYPGTYFSHTRQLGSFMRLSFALYDRETAKEGLSRLGRVLADTGR